MTVSKKAQAADVRGLVQLLAGSGGLRPKTLYFHFLYQSVHHIAADVAEAHTLLPATDDDGGPDARGATFWGAHQRFFKMILMAAKV